MAARAGGVGAVPLLLSLQGRQPEKPLLEVVRDGVRQIVAWCHEIDRDAEIGLNVIMTDGVTLIGTRWGRSLYYTERDGVYDCEICGFPHVHQDANRSYRALVVASEPITHETWIYRITRDLKWDCEPL
jgi:glutamine amidotransferase